MKTLFTKILTVVVLITFFASCNKETEEEKDKNIFSNPTLLAGEPTDHGVMLQARLVTADTLIDNDIVGSTGFGRFEIATKEDFSDSQKSKWLSAENKHDFIVKWQFDSLLAGQKYFYRIAYGSKEEVTTYSSVQSFKTLPGGEATAPVSFVMVTGTHYERFYMGGSFKKGETSDQGKAAYSGEDAPLGFPSLETILKMQPDFYIGNGDNVYYDHPGFDKAITQPDMRAKWHRLFAMPRMSDLMASVPAYWMKDDHDHRFDDSDLGTHEVHGDLPSNELGINTFIEQVPVPSKTYRTYMLNKDVQIWMVEGRDYRSPNKMEDGPDKSMWGAEQMAWLKKSLMESTATFKLLVTPTPMVGPDDKRKTDNHTNPGGFKVEGDDFFAWLKDNDFLNKNFYILCGDRHWQYHSIHPSGFEEFSCGSQVDQNSRLGRLPGDENSTDPEGLIQQPYTSREASGGFLMVKLDYQETPALTFDFYDEYGELLYNHVKTPIEQ